ncbi:MAG: ACT domain-containing protein [Candidatus Thorarchaeota archaeon]
MSGETDLSELLGNMRPKLLDDTYSICTVTEEQLSSMNINPMMVYREAEGITLICKSIQLEGKILQCETDWRVITLTVHSSLVAVGFLAAITAKLADHRISVNVISAYYHDHLLVRNHDANRAIDILHKLSRSKEV